MNTFVSMLILPLCVDVSSLEMLQCTSPKEQYNTFKGNLGFSGRRRTRGNGTWVGFWLWGKLTTIRGRNITSRHSTCGL